MRLRLMRLPSCGCVQRRHKSIDACAVRDGDANVIGQRRGRRRVRGTPGSPPPPGLPPPKLQNAERTQPARERESDVVGEAHRPADVVALGWPPVPERGADLDAPAVSVLATES